jgi:hypothetical protein
MRYVVLLCFVALLSGCVHVDTEKHERHADAGPAVVTPAT